MMVKKPLALRPLIVVSGLARCGTSLTMQMLHAAGLTCAGDWPAFEPLELNCMTTSRKTTHKYLEPFDAAKIIDLHRASIDWCRFDRPIIALWLRRDYLNQAASQVKLLTQVQGMNLAGGGAQAALAIKRGLPSETESALLSMKRDGIPYLVLQFEDAIERPREFLRSLAPALDPWYSEIDWQKMIDCVRPRPTGSSCAPGMDLELSLMQELERGGPSQCSR